MFFFSVEKRLLCEVSRESNRCSVEPSHCKDWLGKNWSNPLQQGGNRSKVLGEEEEEKRRKSTPSETMRQKRERDGERERKRERERERERDCDLTRGGHVVLKCLEREGRNTFLLFCWFLIIILY